ncbi:MAG: amidohydrolase family protein, partial [Gemmatimonadaceae bacterium]
MTGVAPAQSAPAARVGAHEKPDIAIFVNASQVVTCAGPARARRGAEMNDAGVRDGVGVAVDRSSGRILAVAPDAELRASHPRATLEDCAGGVLVPGFVDSHTHAIFGRARYEEQELRAAGVGYLEIARRGGGIHSSVRDLRTRDASDLATLAAARLRRIAAHGTTTVEVKSGYGLSLESELTTLRVIRELDGESLAAGEGIVGGQDTPRGTGSLGGALRLVPTFLGAHEVPLEFREAPRTREEYIALVTREMIPAVAREGLARFCDVFCEPGVYTVDESRRIL